MAGSVLGKRTRSATAAIDSSLSTNNKRIATAYKVAKPAIEVYQDSKSDLKNPQTPSTPRHRDALSKKVLITPRHRVLTPKKLVTPSHASTSVYNQARQLFSRCSAPGRLVGRDAERDEITTFVDACLDSKLGGCLYVSGPPGTGKSALVGEATEQYKERANLRTSVVNCMSIRNAKDLAQKLSEDLGLADAVSFDKLRSCFVRGRAKDAQKYMVILDEVDRLVDLDLDLLYSLFEWSMQPSSRLILIGIANALDLTDRFLPRLKGRHLKPELLPFMPYTAAQIGQVITSKLRSLAPNETGIVPFLHPAAISFCAKKVAAQTGDLRKAFDICRRAIDLVEQDVKMEGSRGLEHSPSKTPLIENMNLSSPVRSPKKSESTTYTVDTAPKATIAHMAKVTAQVFGNGATQRLGTLNIQQKAVLCSLSALEKRRRDTQVERAMFSTPTKSNNPSAPTIKQLFEAYSSACKQEKLLHPLTSVEFRDVVSGLETLSLVSAVDAKNSSFVLPLTPSKTPTRGRKGGFGTAAVGDERRVASSVGFKELQGCLEGAGSDILREILEGDGGF
ncbi:Cell division control protein 6 [Teratosphaeria destructans]|uniref:Cell division control protein n=1 Tax=Teratosphaeria destructans TaxID=418781 RepID=A0A9W7SUZ4_9PEZI|nr:Cell division control protein 6 [Teratosphaeria destructans]